ncbi:MAG: hypothetical protein ACLGIO_07960, partial [Acidimicrobiia bacterium]
AAGDDAQRSLGVSLAAASVVPLATYVTFDGLSFPVVTGLAFLVLGCAGAAWRLCAAGSDGRRVPAQAPEPEAAGT